MGQRSNYAAVKDALIKLKMEECALGMGQKSNYVAVKDAQIKLKSEEYVRGMVLSSTHLINLLHLDQNLNLNRLLQLNPYPVNVLREQLPEDKEEVSFPKR